MSAMTRSTREIRIGNVKIGGANPIAVQSMAATRTQDIAATIRQVELLEAAGADVIRIAVDNPRDVVALADIRSARPNANLSIDLQENYRLAEKVAPYVQKIRYNPGHLHHIERDKPIVEKVRYLVDVAREHGLAMRIGVNAGSVDPEKLAAFDHDSIDPIVESALEHCRILDDLGFDQYCVSIKDSDPNKVIDANIRFAEARPDVPLHLGVTEAGMPPDGIIKTRIAFEQLITRGIGDTIRVSLTLPFERKGDEIVVGHQILDDIAAGRFRSVPRFEHKGLNIISCPSCSRVENEAFIELAQNVREMTEYAKLHDITIAVMGCRVNGPGETDDADLGMWCAPSYVNLKRGPESLGHFTYDEILGKLRQELDKLIDEKTAVAT
ncbi:MAG TPA: (E)-4-hydroxy-3-methylbut-2-enyl-diphosphate synthase [Thermoanaerobaculia bacterium]